MDLQERALLDSYAGKAADVAAKYRLSGSWVRLLKQRRRETGEVAPRVQRHGRRCMLEPHLHTLADLIAAHTLAELKHALATPASVPTVWRAVRALGLTVKKRSARPNTSGLTSRQRGSRGTRRRRPGTSPTSCFWTKPASPTICFGGTAGDRAARGSTTTPPAGAGRPVRFSPRCGSRGRRSATELRPRHAGTAAPAPLSTIVRPVARLARRLSVADQGGCLNQPASVLGCEILNRKTELGRPAS